MLLARRALIALPLSVAGAIAVTFGGYWRQMRAALAPPARVGASARLRRRLARSDDRPRPVARGTADFVLIALARSRPQQVPIAIAASLGVAIASVAVATRPGGLAELQAPRTVVLWIPMVIGYWVIVGLRASFYVPTELAGSLAISRPLDAAVSVLLVGRARLDGRVRDRSVAAGERAGRLFRCLAGESPRGTALFVCIAVADRRAGRVDHGRQRAVYARLSARTHETEDTLAALRRGHVRDGLLSGPVGAAALNDPLAFTNSSRWALR